MLILRAIVDLTILVNILSAFNYQYVD